MSDYNESGVFWFLCALIIITLTGVFLSLMVDKRHETARASHARTDVLANVLSENSAVLIGLRAELKSLEERHRLRLIRSGDTASGLVSEKELQSGIREGIVSLELQRERLRSSLQNLQKVFSDYRARADQVQDRNRLPDNSRIAASREPALQPVAKEAEIAALRAEIAVGRSRISGWKVELSAAESKSRYGDKRSVPGSLRSWGEQATILRNNINRAEVHLALLIEKLRALSPNDPALNLPR